MTIHLLLYFCANRNRRRESIMKNKRRRFNSMMVKKGLKHRCGLSKSMGSLGSIENTGESEDTNRNDRDKNIHSWDDSDISSYSNVDHLFGIKDIRNFISYATFYDTQYSWNNHINSCIDTYFHSQSIDTYVVSGNHNYSDSSIYSYICGESGNTSEGESSGIIIGPDENDFTIEEEENIKEEENIEENASGFSKYRHLWVHCENCYGLIYKKFLKSQMNICEECGFHLKMNSLDRIELLIDSGTWDPMDEDMVSLDPIEWDSEEDPYKAEEEPEEDPYKAEEDPYKAEEDPYKAEEEPEEEPEEDPYKDRIDSYQTKTGLTEAVQTGIGCLNGIPVAIGVMDFEFMGGSMGSVVGEKITRLIEYATKKFLPLIIVCASGGARMQEGSLSLMQMAKISSALYYYQLNKKRFYVSILTSPTTGGVTASFGMLGDIIISEPDAYIAFAGKRVIEELLKIEVPEGLQSAEYLFEQGLFDLIVPRNLLKSVLSELFQLHAFVPLNQNSIK
uniref:Acetyl-coenzyme A carboxylase carboxyl transferase subunit beta, chloroplastic n=1 Tax=Alniphyllum pterospermum TaxID=1609849 RepID=A0A481P458_9ERIC|nr:acetyl-CoA carboxylase carboxyl transferase beta [Alniphyllum pterospermum]QAV57929.1 acetyl-CoA carboxylase carboxyl transferase beta [Alniphyllum pterospermum]